MNATIFWKLYTTCYFHLLETHKLFLCIFHGLFCIYKYLKGYTQSQSSNCFWQAERREQELEVMIKVNFTII